MFHQTNRQPKKRTWRSQCVEMLCCLLGLIWVANPNFHSFSHLADLPHQHPTGSAYSHTPKASSNTTSGFEGEDSAIVSVPGERLQLAWSSSPIERSLLGHGGTPHKLSQTASQSNPVSPAEPVEDDDDAPTFYLLEIEVSPTETYEVSVSEALLVFEKLYFESTGFSSLQEKGPFSPRGPPLA